VNLVFGREKILIHHSHNRNDTAHNGTNTGEEGDPSLPVSFFDFHVQWRYFVEEKHPRQAPVRPRIDVSQVFRDTILIRLNYRTVPEFVASGNDLNVKCNNKNVRRNAQDSGSNTMNNAL